MPTARNIPISRVRSNTASARVLTMPNKLTITLKASRADRGTSVGGSI
jgi:hypothetical protein